MSSGAGGGTQGGGAIMAALFLREFIADKDKVQWAHIDAAGTCLAIHCWSCQGPCHGAAAAAGVSPAAVVPDVSQRNKAGDFVHSHTLNLYFLTAGPMIDAENGGASGWGALTLVHWVLGLGQARTAAVFGFKDIPLSPKKQ